MESRNTARSSKTEHPGRDSRSRRKNETVAAPEQRVSVMEAVSTLDYQGYVAVERSPKNRESVSQEDLLSALGVEDSSVKLMVPVTRSISKRRDRSSSRTRRTVEEKKQSIRESRARERSRSRSNTRPAQVVPPDMASYSSVAPSISLMSRESSVTTEKTRTSRRPTSGKADKKQSTTQQLIILRHAARCPYGPDSPDKETRGKCPIHKQCADTKELLGHMTMCHATVGGCPFPSCDSSKGLLEVIYPSGVPKATLDTSSAQPHGSSLVAAQSHRRPKNQGSSTTSLLATPPTPISEGSNRKIKDPLDRTARDEPFRPEASCKIDDDATDSPQASRQKKFAPSVELSRSSLAMHSQPSSSKNTGGSRSGSGAEDIEMGAEVGDDTLEQQSLLEMEEQSLLEKEIRARRLQRAPKVKQRAASGNKIHSSSATQSQTSASTTTSELIRNSQTVAREIKLKAEAMMSKMTATTEGRKMRDGEASMFSSRSQAGRWPRIVKFACIGFGFTIIMSITVLILLFIMGGDEWNGLSDIVGTSSSDPTQAPKNAGSVFVDSGASMTTPTTPLDVQNDVYPNTPTMAPTRFEALLPDYTTEVLEADLYNDVASPQTKAFRWIQSEQEFLKDAIERSESTGEAAVSFTAPEWKRRFALATFFYATSMTDTWAHSKNWLTMGVSECDWSFFRCDSGDSMLVADNGLQGK
jgi:TAZ zinc finger